MALVNRPGGLLVTRGLGGEPTNLVVRGFLPFIEDIADIVRGSIIRGRRKKEEIQELFEDLKISVALIAINGKDLITPIINTVRSSYSNNNDINIEVTPKKLVVNKPQVIVEAEVRRKNVIKDWFNDWWRKWINFSS